MRQEVVTHSKAVSPTRGQLVEVNFCLFGDWVNYFEPPVEMNTIHPMFDTGDLS